ncbi:DUF2254 domain-containing protein [Salegentibacter chungangensis]|uniref:DUF2254 domain-containing protein n=1 Tax=Salegentibacter chungangensis TaxID=1335724 RepID=A0ABW3NQR9_9FLAO
MKYLLNRILSFLKTLQSKIAFYPSLFAILGFLLAFTMMYLEKRGVSKYLMDSFPSLVVNNGDTALTILSACITGLISMMVFSFSMVMVLLNQASTNYSPRLLPGLISDKRHQIILGTYLATILYCIFIAVSIQPSGEKYQVPGFAVLIGIIFTVICIWAFIYFIHNISQSIQINNILDGIYHTAKKRLNKLIESEKTEAEFPSTDNWIVYNTKKSGYFQNVSLNYLVDICEQHDTQLEIIPVKGIFVLEDTPVFRCRKELEESTVDQILSNFIFSRGELVEDNYVLAFKQITEIIVKAMSPGINDPGTALNGIDYLTELFGLRMQKNDESYIIRDNSAYLKLSAVSFDELLYNVMASIRTYCKHDIILVQKLGEMLIYLNNKPAQSDSYHNSVIEAAETLFNDAGRELINKTDRKVLEAYGEKFNLKLQIS